MKSADIFYSSSGLLMSSQTLLNTLKTGSSGFRSAGILSYVSHAGGKCDAVFCVLPHRRLPAENFTAHDPTVHAEGDLDRDDVDDDDAALGAEKDDDDDDDKDDDFDHEIDDD